MKIVTLEFRKLAKTFTFQCSLALVEFRIQIPGGFCSSSSPPPPHSSHICNIICQFPPPLSGAEPEKHPRRDSGDHKQILIENSPKSSYVPA